MQAWRTKVVATYYQRYAAMVRALDPEHLILGIRYKGVPERALFTALSPYFDVNSINDYTRSGHLKPVYTALYQTTGKPLMITEFSFSGFPFPSSSRLSVSRWVRRPSVVSATTRTYGRRRGHPSWWGCIGSCGAIMRRRPPRRAIPIRQTSMWASSPPMRPRCMRNSDTGSRGPMRRWRRSIEGAARRHRRSLCPSAVPGHGSCP